MRQISSVWQRETPKAGRPCHPGAAEAVETPGAKPEVGFARCCPLTLRACRTRCEWSIRGPSTTSWTGATAGSQSAGWPGRCSRPELRRRPGACCLRPVRRVAVQARSWKLVHVCAGLCLGDWPARHSNGVAVFLDQFYLVEPLIWNQRGQNQLSVGGKLHVEPVTRLGWRQDHAPFSIGCDCHKGSIPPEACDSKTF